MKCVQFGRSEKLRRAGRKESDESARFPFLALRILGRVSGGT